MAVVRNTSSSVIADTISDIAVASASGLSAEIGSGRLLATGAYLTVDGSQIVDAITDFSGLSVEASAGIAQSSLAGVIVEAKREGRVHVSDVLEFVLCTEANVPESYLFDAYDKAYVDSLSDVGGGGFSIHTKSANYPNIEIGKIVRVLYGGAAVGAWRIESIDASFSDEVLATAKVKGRGLLADLEAALVYPDGATKQRSWSSTTCASVLIDLMDEAVTRGCALPTVDFSASDDSASHPFGESIDFKIDAGATVLDAIRKLHAIADFDVSVGYDYTLKAWIERGGYDTEIRLINGHNLRTFDEQKDATEKANAVLVESSTGFATVARTASRRIETYLNVTREDSTYASYLADVLLDKIEDVQTRYKIETGTIRPFFDFNTGDYLYLYGQSTAYRILQIAISDGTLPNEISCSILLNSQKQEWLQRVDGALRQNGAGIGKATSSNLTSKAPAAGSGGGSVTPHTHVEADITDLSYDAHSIRGRAVAAGTPSDGVILKYVHAALEWQYQAFISALSQLSDVALSSPVSGDLLRHNGTAWVNSTLASAGISPVSHTHVGQSVFAKAGTLAVETGTLRIYNQTGRTLSISKVFASVGAAPSGADLTMNVMYDGSSAISPTVTISAGANTGSQTLGTAHSWADGHYLTLTITQVGSSTAGAELTVTIIYD